LEICQHTYIQLNDSFVHRLSPHGNNFEITPTNNFLKLKQQNLLKKNTFMKESTKFKKKTLSSIAIWIWVVIFLMATKVNNLLGTSKKIRLTFAKKIHQLSL